MTSGMDLKVERIRAGINQADLAARIGVTRPTLSRWESMARVPAPKAERYLTAVREVSGVGDFS